MSKQKLTSNFFFMTSAFVIDEIWAELDKTRCGIQQMGNGFWLTVSLWLELKCLGRSVDLTVIENNIYRPEIFYTYFTFFCQNGIFFLSLDVVHFFCGANIFVGPDFFVFICNFFYAVSGNVSS